MIEPAKAHTPPLPNRASELVQPPRIPDHELLRRIGRGSYGEVWLARSVTGAYRAVKIVHRQSFDHDRPFEREFSGILKFEPISRKHDSQVDILHVGRGEDCFYYVMELADDQVTAQQINPDSYAAKTLKSELFQRGKLPFEECVQISLALTTALDHLHANGLVHRDVKPSNIIFVNGVPKLADIGLVTGVDATRSLVGTEGFAPPEGPGTPQADIYSLGKVLYEICTGKDRQEFPELPTNLDALSDREGLLELNAVIAKACRTEPRDRYASANTMHDELLLLQSGKSLARLRTMERTVARLKRSSVAIAVVTVLATAAFLYQSHQTRVVKNLAAENLALASRAQGSSKESQDRLVQMQIANAVRLMDQGEPVRSLLWLAEAFKNIEGDPTREEMHRIRISSVLANCTKLWRVIAHDASVQQAVFSPDGSRLATFSREGDGSAYFTSIFDLNTGAQVVKLTHTNTVTAIAFSPDGHRLIVGGESWNGLFDSRTGESLMPARVQHAFAMSSDGELIFAVSDQRKGQVVAVRTGAALGDPIEPGHRIVMATFSRNNRSLLVLDAEGGDGFRPDSQAGYLSVYDVQTGRPSGTPIKFADAPAALSISFSPDGAQIATSINEWRKGWLPEAHLWNVADGSLAAVLKHDSGVADCNYSDDGQWLITTSDAMQIWDIKTGTPIGPPMKDGPRFALSPDGLLLATGSDGAAAHAWNPFTGEPVVPALHSGMHVRGVAFSPDGRYLAVASTDKTVRIWDLASLGRAERIFKLPGAATYATFSPDGNQLLVTSPEEARVWDVGTGEAKSPPFDAGAQLLETRFSPDARLAVTCGGHLYEGLVADAMGVFVWNTATARLALPPLLIHEFVRHAEFSPDGQRFVTASFEKYARVWNTRSGEPITPPLQHEGPLRYAAFSPDGRQVVTASDDRTARLWDASTGARLLGPFKHNFDVNYATFSPDGKTIVTASRDQSVRLWSAVTGEPLTPRLFHAGSVVKAAFSPDGQLLLSAGLAGHVPMWQPNKPDPLLTVLNHGARVRAVSFSADGKFILSAGGNSAARLWEVATGELVSDSLKHRKEVMHAEFRPNHDQQFVTASADKTVRLWTLHKWKYSAKTLTEFAQLLSSLRLGRNGTLMPIEPEKLAALSDSLHSQCPELFETPASDVLAWHREMAEMGARHEQWRAVIWRLDKVLAAEPGDLESIRLRATAYAETGQWSESRRDFEAALKADQKDAQNWVNLALNCLATDDLSGYRKLCADALRHFDHEPDPHAVLQLAGLCSLLPDAISDYGFLLKLIGGALEQRPINPLYVREHGAALYRAGQFEEAARELERSGALQRHEFTSSSGEKNVSPKTDRWEESFGMLFLALADQRSGNSVPTQAAWQDARRLIEKWLPKKLSENGPDWTARLRLNLLRREAEALFNGQRSGEVSTPRFPDAGPKGDHHPNP